MLGRCRQGRRRNLPRLSTDDTSTRQQPGRVSLQELVLGTTNRKKVLELRDLLKTTPLTLISLDDLPAVAEVDETGDSFLANAELKATQLALELNRWVLAEDSGLCVDALNGRPGIFSARYAGDPRSDERNNDLLLQELNDVPTASRTAHYHCAVVISDPEGTVRATSEGTCDGIILDARHGTGGFGYDPLFFIPSAKLTFGELPFEFKQQHSHRAHAIRQLLPRLCQLFG